MQVIKLIFITIVIVFLTSCNETNHKEKKQKTFATDSNIVQQKKSNTFFDIDTSNFVVKSSKIKKNQNLGDILSKNNVSYEIIDSLTKFDSVFDFRKIKAGNKYYFIFSKDSGLTPKYMIYQIDKVNYITCGLNDSIFVKKSEKEIIIKQSKLKAKITSSLWNAIVDQGKDPMIANDLSDIYAWTIDFFGLQKNDSFTVIYTEKWVDSTYVSIDTIFASKFTHNNQNFYAFLFYQDDRYSYFDEKGNSLRKAFLKAPLKYSRISSRFTNSRYHPILKIRRPHHGVDYAAPTGTPVYSIGDGKVIKVGWAGGGGRCVKIKHNSVYTTSYMHLSRYAKGIKVGDYVKQGQLIGYVGQSGLATGPHLDFRVYKNRKPIDPLKMEAPPVEPVKKENMKRFNEVKTSMLNY